MAITVAEIMNPELFSVTESDRVDDTLATLLALGLSAAPVVDSSRHPTAMVSWRDLVKATGGETIAGRMTRPPAVVRESDSIKAAGSLMAITGFHHAPVVDANGELIGFVSLLDVVRGLLGIPAGHPVGFPHYDSDTGAVWTDPHPLVEAHLEAAPQGPGVWVLIVGGRNAPEQVVWAEATAEVRSRLLDLLSEPQEPRLARLLEEEYLRFRAAAVPDAKRREDLAALLMNGARRHSWLERIND